MKIGVIGFGSIGQRHYKNLTKYTKNVAVFSKRKDIALPQVFHKWSDFVKNGPYGGIIIANETAKHISTVKKCLVLTRAIFIEKPLSHSSSGLMALDRLLKRKKISAWVGYCMYFFKPFLEIKNILKSEKLGRIYYMRVSVGQDLRGWRPGRDYAKIYSAKKEQGGGVMLDLVHDINYPAWLLDDVLMPKKALVGKISNLKIDTEDFAESIFVGKKSGAIVSLHQDYLRIPGRRSLEIVGEKGSLVWDSLSNAIILESIDKISQKKIVAERNEMYQKEIKFFLNQIKQGKYFSNLSEAIRDIKNIEYLKKQGD